MTVRIGLIGAGGISGGHVDALSKIESAKLVAVCDIDRSRAENRAKAADAQVFTDYRRMLSEVQLDALWLCTTPNVRVEPLELAIEKKIPVFTEKPVADNLAMARTVAEKIEKSKLPVMVGYVLRYMLITDRLKEYLRKDNITLVSSFYCCPMSLDYRDKRPVTKWFFNKKISGGAINDQATHTFDMLRYLMGDVAEMYSIGSNVVVPKDSEYTVEDSYTVAFKFKSGVPGAHCHTWGHCRWRSGITFYGEKGMYAIDFADGKLRVELANSETILYKPQDSPMYNEDLVFIQMVQSGDFSKMHSTFSDGVKTLEMTTRCLEVLNLPTTGIISGT
jgi:myo-inositol 2-dehydrogenase / D-chiro-inositol 1-dehydrogenase